MRLSKLSVGDLSVYQWILIGNAYGLNGMGHDEIQLYNRMPAEMRNDKTHVCVLNACSNSGLVNECRSIFATIPNKNHYIYTTIVTESIL